MDGLFKFVAQTTLGVGLFSLLAFGLAAMSSFPALPALSSVMVIGAGLLVAGLLTAAFAELMSPGLVTGVMDVAGLGHGS